MTDSKTWFVIINPTSGNGSSKKKWPEIQKLLITYQFTFEFVFTEYANHSTELIQTAIRQGYRRVICIGGDGTLHNIVNGIMLQKEVPSNHIHIGVIPIGTGNDWVKTHHISNHLEKAIQTIKNGDLKQQDVGEIELIGLNRNPIYFINLAGIGFDGYIVSKVNKYKHFGALAYVTGAILGLFSFKNFHSKVIIDTQLIESKTLMIVVGLCKYSGGGMQLTNNSNPFDGLFDVSIAKNISKGDIIKNILKLFTGEITNHKKVETFKSNAISIEVLDNTNPIIEADGEVVGIGNLHISINTKAFSFYC
ncbi:diacylglycerol/lipid kinase family protein [Xanthomarina sp. F2636L]|uniref:diacylglycerol/lipid kinase family protein n=1 Tax=Xanthomarina sp. F2636L TaxID=2996018 RepID=UPI00225E44C3|nr:diacylglycerol kinase family protein [Xanthomarina sp. F2636L]MCX7551308.1 diacylglycerol kinase family lipid kinase [Xanthomarina sp. F2636L]